VLTAEELHRRGVEASNHGRVRLAGRLLTRAHERTTDQELLCRIEASQAYVALEIGDPVTAHSLCQKALARPGIGRPQKGVLLSQLAMVQMRMGDLREALESFTAGIALLDAPAELGKARGNRGDVHLHQGRVRVAIEDFEAAVRHFSDAGLAIDKAKAEHNLGYARLLDGDLVGALRAMESAYEVLSPVSPVLKAICEQDRAEVLLAAGLTREGVGLLAQAARDYGARGLRQRQGEAELTLARNLQLTEPREGREAARRASGRFRRLGAPAWQARADAVMVGAEVELGHKGPSLLARSEALEQQLTEQGLRWGAATVRLHASRVLVRRGELDAAGERLVAVRTNGQAPLAVRLLARDVRAELAERQGHRGRALGHLRAGLADLHSWQSSFGNLDLQTNVVGQGNRLGVRALALAADSRNPQVLFEWSERARMLASRIQPVRAPQDESMVADLAELREIAQVREGARVVSPEREAELRQQVRERAWHHRGSGEVADPVSLADLQDGLADGLALVAYVVTGNRVVALAVTDRAATQLDLGERAPLDDLLDGLLPDLDMAASDLPDPLAAAVRRELADRLDLLAGVLVAPVLDAVGDRQVVLTPSGVLAAVPWNLLTGFVGRPVTVAQSATSWLAGRGSPLRAGSAGLVAGPRVDRAEEEVLAVAKEWSRVEVLTGLEATAESVSRLASGVDVLHVAAHGRHSAENPMFSGLELVDGPWYGYDIDQLRAVPDVVLLSACEVGASTVRWGEELIGMAGAWLHAGSRRVVASAAAVNDRAAFEALVRVHERLSAGADPAVALADAVPAVSADAPPVPLVCFA
jgi:tetratricopeptide (TPR) repeat protein